MALAPANFGTFSNDLLVGNFGDGRINAYNLATGRYDGQLKDAAGQPIAIDKLWGLAFGSGTRDRRRGERALFHGRPDDESHGVFGKLSVAEKKNGKD